MVKTDAAYSFSRVGGEQENCAYQHLFLERIQAGLCPQTNALKLTNDSLFLL